MSCEGNGYLCYDIRGIQGYIFQIPRLRYIVGGSALIDRFDRETVPKLADTLGFERISSGGGKGAFRCTREQANELQKALIQEAHAIGADIRFGFNHDYSEAVHCADRLFPYLPDSLDGHPCPASGLYPVAEGEDVHSIVGKRDYHRGERMGRWFEERLLEGQPLQLPPGLNDKPLAFFRNVDGSDKDDPQAGEVGCQVLGGRNRWAVVCMDGNDMGTQFGAMAEVARSNPDAMQNWVRELGDALDECSEKACLKGMQRVLAEWAANPEVGRKLQTGGFDVGDNRVVPIRPLVVGGDDIAVLCHAAHAATFVTEACRAFEEHSIERAKQAREKGIDLWPATNGRITISAGILYCGVSLPLATAIPYAENLLASAKGKGRAIKGDRKGEPVPACVDFEAVTESMLDAPATRRQREIVFLDGDLGNQLVRLTRRPYTVAKFTDLLDDAKKLDLPGSILHQLLPGLRAGFHDRQLFRYRLGKRQEKLFAALAEEDTKGERNRIPEGSRWRLEEDGKDENGKHMHCRTTDLLDMVLLVQEDRRMAKETVQ